MYDCWCANNRCLYCVTIDQELSVNHIKTKMKRYAYSLSMSIDRHRSNQQSAQTVQITHTKLSSLLAEVSWWTRSTYLSILLVDETCRNQHSDTNIGYRDVYKEIHKYESLCMIAGVQTTVVCTVLRSIKNCRSTTVRTINNQIPIRPAQTNDNEIKPYELHRIGISVNVCELR
jgi:hypothetical protein